MAKRLLAAGAETNIPNSIGECPLQWAAWSGSTELLELFLKNSADLHARNTLASAGKRAGWTALLCAAHQVETSLLTIAPQASRCSDSWPWIRGSLCLKPTCPGLQPAELVSAGPEALHACQQAASSVYIVAMSRTVPEAELDGVLMLLSHGRSITDALYPHQALRATA